MALADAATWAQATLGQCALGDERRTQRLVDIGKRWARQAGASMAQCCEGEPAAQLGSYRFLRNQQVSAAAIAEGGFAPAVRGALASERWLALEDTTTLSYRHAVAEQWGPVGNRSEAVHQGYLVHSVLLVDGESERTLGLIEPQHWCRDRAQHGKKHARKQRAYADQESMQWQRASERMATRLGPAMARVISVCDRESDIYEYLHYKHAQGQRFVVRARVDRRVQGDAVYLFATLAACAREVGCQRVHVAQRGGRKARTAKLALRAATLTVQPPARMGKAGAPIEVHAVVAEEVDAPTGVKPLCWRLLTSEPVDDLAAAQRVVRDYALRWRIEDYHKAWKSGVGVERQRMQEASNLARMLVITAFVAVRLLQLREAVEATPSPHGDTPQATPLEPEEWRVLWASTERSTPPTEPPSAAWAYRALAKLGGFTDTKRTGRAGWATLWYGWSRLQERLEGYRLSQHLAAQL